MKQVNILKSTLILISTFLFINAASCQTKAKTQKGTKTKTPACAVKIDFASPGTGIDYKTFEEMKKMIDDKKVKYTETRKGKEGETQWCLPLTELKGADKTAFIEQLKKTASAGQLVSLSSN
jgi:hypothetical protein